ncbi:MAG: cyclic nucleotide-binding domain-containing protein [Myxococcota bacterium]
MAPTPRGRAPDDFADPLELRADPRIASDTPARVFTSDFRGSLPAQLRDLSVHGACIATASPFAFKSIERVELALPSGPLAVRASGRWQRDEEADDVVLTGVAFDGIEPETYDRLWEAVVHGGHVLARFLLECCDLPELALEDAIGLAQVTRRRSVPVGRAIYRQGDADAGTHSFFLVWSGEVALTLRIRNAIERETARLQRGGAFGGLPLVAGAPHAESAIAATDCELLEIDAGSFAYLRTARPWLGLRMGQVLLRTNAQRLLRVLDEATR